MNARIGFFLIVVPASWIACSSVEVGPAPDAGTQGSDAGSRDAGRLRDASTRTDASSEADATRPRDAEVVLDAGSARDASVATDASTRTDASVGTDAGASDSGTVMTRPNIVFILADDQRAASIECMPKLQARLGQSGVTFTHNFATTPLCCPGRSTVLTSKYAHNHGVRTNGDEEDGETASTPGAIDFIENGNEERVVVRWLNDVGYRTGLYGKYMNGYVELTDQAATLNYVPPHWDEWHAFRKSAYFDFQLVERGQYFSTTSRGCYASSLTVGGTPAECTSGADRIVDDGAENHSTDVLAKKAVRFIRDSATEGVPFFLYFAPYAPHMPAQSPARYQPDREVTAFTDEAMTRLGTCPAFRWDNRPESFMEADVSDKPEWVQGLVDQATRAHLNDIRKRQLVSVLATEDAIEDIVAALEDNGVADNTILVYSADNGYAWGEHWWHKKNCTYEECSRIPLVVFDPRRPQSGRTSALMTANVDLAPTFADWAGATAPLDIDGFSLRGLIDGTRTTPVRDRVLTECWANGNTMPAAHASVRTDRWKYVEYYADTARTTIRIRTVDALPELELYDLSRDPYELDNLVRLDADALAARGYPPGEVATVMQDLALELETLRND